jgi:hypothetical protein
METANLSQDQGSPDPTVLYLRASASSADGPLFMFVDWGNSRVKRGHPQMAQMFADETVLLSAIICVICG